MRRVRRETSTGEVALMAVMTKAMGAFLVIMILLLPYYVGDPEGEQTAASTKEHVDDAKKKAKEIKDEIRNDLANGLTVDGDGLLSKIELIEKELDEANVLIEQLKIKAEQATSQINRLNQEYEDLRRRVAELEAEVERLRARIVELQRQIEQLQAEVLAQRALNVQLQAQIDELRARNAQLDAENRALQAQAEQMRQELREKDARISQLERDNRAKDAEIERLRRERQQLVYETLYVEVLAEVCNNGEFDFYVKPKLGPARTAQLTLRYLRNPPTRPVNHIDFIISNVQPGDVFEVYGLIHNNPIGRCGANLTLYAGGERLRTIVYFGGDSITLMGTYRLDRGGISDLKADPIPFSIVSAGPNVATWRALVAPDLNEATKFVTAPSELLSDLKAWQAKSGAPDIVAEFFRHQVTWNRISLSAARQRIPVAPPDSTNPNESKDASKDGGQSGSNDGASTTDGGDQRQGNLGAGFGFGGPRASDAQVLIGRLEALGVRREVAGLMVQEVLSSHLTFADLQRYAPLFKRDAGDEKIANPPDAFPRLTRSFQKANLSGPIIGVIHFAVMDNLISADVLEARLKDWSPNAPARGGTANIKPPDSASPAPKPDAPKADAPKPDTPKSDGPPKLTAEGQVIADRFATQGVWPPIAIPLAYLVDSKVVTLAEAQRFAPLYKVDTTGVSAKDRDSTATENRVAEIGGAAGMPPPLILVTQAAVKLGYISIDVLEKRIKELPK